jgi:L-ascorbate metabolism protein UlaG (beta-lactamase superfamily)
VKWSNAKDLCFATSSPPDGTSIGAPVTSLQPYGTVELTWLGQSGFLLRFASANVLVDPFLTDRGGRLVPAPPLESLGSVDILAATHEHWDHLDLPAIVRLLDLHPRMLVVVPLPIVDQVLDAGVASERIRGVQPDEVVVHRDLRITPVPARHGVHVSDAYDFGTELSDGKVRYLGYVLSEEGVVVYHAGDTILYDEHASRLEALGVQLALLPINGRDPERESVDIVGNLSPDEAASLIARARVSAVVPMHYDMFAGNLGDPGSLVSAVVSGAPDAAVLIPAHQRGFVFTGIGT